MGGRHGGSKGTEPSKGRKGGVGLEDELLWLALALGVCHVRRGGLEKVEEMGRVVGVMKAMVVMRVGRMVRSDEGIVSTRVCDVEVMDEKRGVGCTLLSTIFLFGSCNNKKNLRVSQLWPIKLSYP